jgi:hypothetical protein
MAKHVNGPSRTTASNRDAAVAAFKQTFRAVAPYKHRYEVFRDFVTMAACSLHNGLHKDAGREQEYMTVIKDGAVKSRFTLCVSRSIFWHDYITR